MGRVVKMKKNVGKLSKKDKLKLLNKLAGQDVAFDLSASNPTEVTEWIPTGSRWLDSIIKRGQLGGIPVGKITEIAGLQSTGKSFLAAQISANAQKQGKDVFYFDSESAIDPTFLIKAGCDLGDVSDDLGDFTYVQAKSVEFVLESIETVINAGVEGALFVWDSVALTPTISDIETDMNPQRTMAMKARILSKALSKLIQPITNSNSTLLCLNQLKANISASTPAMALVTPYITPGGKALNYSYSLRIWLTGRKAKASFVYDDKGYRIGSEVKVKLEKSRFGTQGRTCNFKILWGENVGVQDEESWFDAVNSSKYLNNSGAWFSLDLGDGKTKKFQKKNWVNLLQTDEGFRKRVLEIMDEEVILKFDKRLGDASNYYDTEGGEE